MDNYSYNSYPESGNSSPRSREFDFENPPPWGDDQSQPAQNYKAKFMCSYGGKIQPRPHDNQLSYIGGETKILAVDYTTKFSSMISKLNALCGGGCDEVSFKYQLPGEDLDALISVTNDDDLDHMMHEYDRLFRASAKPARMRLFIFSATNSSSFGSEGSKSERGRFVEALNSGPTPGGEKHAAIPQSKVDFLFGIEKGMPESQPPPIQIRDPVAEPINPPPPPLQEVVGPDHVLNPIEFQRQLQNLQRVQIREQEQLAMYRKKAEDAAAAAASMAYNNTGEYYAQKIPEKAPPVNMPVTFQQHVPATSGFWSDKPISVGGFPTPVTINTGPRPPSEHPVYMIQAPGPGQATVYPTHQPVKVPTSATAAPQMVRSVTGQAGQGYYTNVQRMPHEVYREQHVYNMVAQAQQQPPPAQHPPIYGMPQQMVRPPPSGGVSDASYAQVAAAYDRQPVYYTAPGSVMMPPQFQGVGVAVSGEMRRGSGGGGSEGKTGNKVLQGSV